MSLDGLIAAGRVERIETAPAVVDDQFGAARRHLRAARAVQTLDPAGAFQLAYDAARTSLAALLLARGLRSLPAARMG